MTYIAIVASLYKPTAEQLGRLERMLDLCDTMILVDDSGAGCAAQVPTTLGSRAVVLRNDANSGLAYSLNRGIGQAVAIGAAIVLTVDQDATLPEGYVRTAVRLLKARLEIDPRTAGVAPGSVNGFPPRTRHRHGTVTCAFDVVQSGLVLTTESWQAVGGFGESLFIDALESDYVLRLHRYDRHLSVESTLGLSHAIGSGPPATTGMRRGPSPTNHSVSRNYYFARNHIYLATRHAHREPSWGRYALGAATRRATKVLSYESLRRPKLLAIALGILHGIIGRLGRAPNSITRADHRERA